MVNTKPKPRQGAKSYYLSSGEHQQKLLNLYTADQFAMNNCLHLHGKPVISTQYPGIETA